VDLTNCRYLPLSTAEKYSDYALQEGDLLFTRYNGSRELAGVCGRVSEIDQTIVYPDKLIRGVPIQIGEDTSLFVAIATNTGASRKYVEAHLFTTAGQWGISGRNLKFTPIPFPPVAEQAHIAHEVLSRLNAADRLEAALEQQLDRARATRRSLLREALSGQLVAQTPTDEDASFLLKRIQHARLLEAQSLRDKRMPKSKSKSKVPRRPLLDVLRENQKPMTPEELFKDSGYQQEFEENECRQEIVDRFYEELRQQVSLPGPIVERRPDKSTVLLELKS
jgi:type I restriction enzyme S subunit